MAEPASVRAWDLPTRLFKWTLVALVVAAPLTKWYGDVTLYWHRMVGYAILTLIVWRVLWGFVGGSTARFSSFVRSPVAALRYGLDSVRGRSPHYLGHNPLGTWMILALLALLFVQAVTGLFSTDDIITDGPFKHFVTHATSKFLTGIHDNIPKLLFILVPIHVIANLAYLAKGENLVGAMVTGRKPAGTYADGAEATGGSIVLALVCLALAGGVVYGTLWLVGRSAFS